jgi:hypothetical protein
MKTIVIVTTAFLLSFRIFAEDQLYTGAWWETATRTPDLNKGGGTLDIKLSGTEGTNGVAEFTAFDLHQPQTFSGTWQLTKNTNIVHITVTNTPGPKWQGTLNKAKEQVSGTWTRKPFNKGKFQAIRWYGLAE